MDNFGRFIRSLDDSIRHLYCVGDSNAKRHQDCKLVNLASYYDMIARRFTSIYRIICCCMLAPKINNRSAEYQRRGRECTMPLCPVCHRQPTLKLQCPVSPEWSKTWDGQPWNSVAKTAAWLWCTRSLTTRWTLPPHLNAACHSLLPEAMSHVLCSHNAAVLHTQTPSSHTLPGTGTCYLLIHQHPIPLTPSRATWTPNHRLSIVFNLIELSRWNFLAAVRSSSVRSCTFMEEEEEEEGGEITWKDDDATYAKMRCLAASFPDSVMGKNAPIWYGFLIEKWQCIAALLVFSLFFCYTFRL